MLAVQGASCSRTQSGTSSNLRRRDPAYLAWRQGEAPGCNPAPAHSLGRQQRRQLPKGSGGNAADGEHSSSGSESVRAATRAAAASTVLAASTCDNEVAVALGALVAATTAAWQVERARALLRQRWLGDLAAALPGKRVSWPAGASEHHSLLVGLRRLRRGGGPSREVSSLGGLRASSVNQAAASGVATVKSGNRRVALHHLGRSADQGQSARRAALESQGATAAAAVAAAALGTFP